jgi:hypothetical protein
MTYEIRIDEKRKRPVIIYVKQGRITLHVIRGDNVEDTERTAREWIRERTSVQA